MDSFLFLVNKQKLFNKTTTRVCEHHECIENEITIVVVFYSFMYGDHFAEGLRLQNLNRHEEALQDVKAYDMAIKHNPTHSGAYNNKGNCLYQLNRIEDAIASYDMAIKHNPTYSKAFKNRGFCLTKLNRHEEALAACDMAIKHNPNNEPIINNRKLLLEKSK